MNNSQKIKNPLIHQPVEIENQFHQEQKRPKQNHKSINNNNNFNNQKIALKQTKSLIKTSVITLSKVSQLERNLKQQLQQAVYEKDIEQGKKVFYQTKEFLDEMFEEHCSDEIQNELIINKLNNFCHNLNKIEKALITQNLILLQSYCQQLVHNNNDMVESCILFQYGLNGELQECVKTQEQIWENNQLLIDQNSKNNSNKNKQMHQYHHKYKSEIPISSIENNNNSSNVNESNLIQIQQSKNNVQQSNLILSNNNNNNNNNFLTNSQLQMRNNAVFQSHNNPFEFNNLVRTNNPQQQQNDQLETYIYKVDYNNVSVTQIQQQEQVFEEMLQNYQKMLEYKELTQLDYSFEYLEKIQNQIQILNNSDLSLETKSKLESFINEQKQMFEELIILKKDMESAIYWLEKEDGWSIDKDNGKQKILYRKIENQPLIVIKASQKMKINLKNLVSMIYEVDLYNHWFPFCKATHGIKEPGIHQKTNYIKISPPLLSDREVYSWGWGIDRMEKHNHFLICVKSFDQDIKFQKKHDIKIPPEGKTVRTDLKVGTFKLVPINNEEVEFTMVLDFDGKFTVPNSIQNFITRKFASLFMERIEKNCQPKKYNGSVWEQQVQQNPEFYNWIEEQFVKPLAVRLEEQKKQKEKQMNN